MNMLACIAGACPHFNWRSFVPVFLQLDREITQIKKTFLGGRQLDRWLGHSPKMVGVDSQIVPFHNDFPRAAGGLKNVN